MSHALSNLPLPYATVAERSAPGAYYSCNLAALESPTTLCQTACPKRTISYELRATSYKLEDIVMLTLCAMVSGFEDWDWVVMVIPYVDAPGLPSFHEHGVR